MTGRLLLTEHLGQRLSTGLHAVKFGTHVSQERRYAGSALGLAVGLLLRRVATNRGREGIPMVGTSFREIVVPGAVNELLRLQTREGYACFLHRAIPAARGQRGSFRIHLM